MVDMQILCCYADVYKIQYSLIFHKIDIAIKSRNDINTFIYHFYGMSISNIYLSHKYIADLFVVIEV